MRKVPILDTLYKNVHWNQNHPHARGYVELVAAFVIVLGMVVVTKSLEFLCIHESVGYLFSTNYSLDDTMCWHIASMCDCLPTTLRINGCLPATCISVYRILFNYLQRNYFLTLLCIVLSMKNHSSCSDYEYINTVLFTYHYRNSEHVYHCVAHWHVRWLD